MVSLVSVEPSWRWHAERRLGSRARSSWIRPMHGAYLVPVLAPAHEATARSWLAPGGLYPGNRRSPSAASNAKPEIEAWKLELVAPILQRAAEVPSQQQFAKALDSLNSPMSEWDSRSAAALVSLIPWRTEFADVAVHQLLQWAMERREASVRGEVILYLGSLVPRPASASSGLLALVSNAEFPDVLRHYAAIKLALDLEAIELVPRSLVELLVSTTATEVEREWSLSLLARYGAAARPLLGSLEAFAAHAAETRLGRMAAHVCDLIEADSDD